jgi:hypothetical protein
MTNKKVVDEYSKNQDGLKRMKRVGTLTHIKHMKPAFKSMAGIGGAIRFSSTLPDVLLGGIDGTVHLDDPDVQDVLSRLETHTQEDVQMAKRVVKLKRTQYHNAPYTELITYDWLTQNGAQFAFQVPLNGGRSSQFGQVLDFALFTGGYAIAVPVQGDYWHSRPDVAASDELDMLSAMGQDVNGYRIEKYVTVWERQIYKDRTMVLSFALAGLELGV